jgi:hypothetical protein
MCEMRELENLEQEMANILVQDETYWRQNDAKFRAVAQNVTYEQFEEIGMAAFLKLVDRALALFSMSFTHNLYYRYCLGYALNVRRSEQLSRS